MNWRVCQPQDRMQKTSKLHFGCLPVEEAKAAARKARKRAATARESALQAYLRSRFDAIEQKLDAILRSIQNQR